MNESEETALIRRCQSGDKEAFSILVEQYRGVLFGTAYFMTRDRCLSEDAVQEALVQIWKNLPSLRLQSSLKAWLIRILANEVKQQCRKKQVPTVSLEQVPEMVNNLNITETAIMRDEERWQLRQALEILPSEQGEAVVLRYFSDLTVLEIARILSEREGTIKSRLSRALDRLGKFLRDYKEMNVGM